MAKTVQFIQSKSIYADLIDLAISANVVPMLIGEPGIGKSAFLQQAAASNNFKYVDIRLTGKEAADIGGLPDFVNITDNKGDVTGRMTTFTPTDLFPLKGITSQDALIKRDIHGNILREKDGKTPKRYDGWLVNLEEFTSADDSVQSACYQILLDRIIGKYELHDNVYLVACGNGENDGAIASKIGTAIKSRVTTIKVKCEYKPWITWAHANNIHPHITDYLSWRPELLHKFDPQSDDLNFPCPRTWEMLSNIIEAEGSYSQAVHHLALGTIGKTASEFKNFIAYYASLPKISDILKNPAKADMPTDVGQLYALSGVMAQALCDNVTNNSQMTDLMKYIERMPLENQTVTIKNGVARNRKVVFNSTVNTWCTNNAAVLSNSI